MSECRPDRSSDRSGEADDDAVAPVVAKAIERIEDRGERVRDEQVAHAISALDEDLTDAERAEIEALADRLVERLLAVPETQLQRAARDGEVATIERSVHLFG